MLRTQCCSTSRFRTAANTGNSSPISSAMIATTTSSSTIVNPAGGGARRDGEIGKWNNGVMECSGVSVSRTGILVPGALWAVVLLPPDSEDQDYGEGSA